MPRTQVAMYKLGANTRLYSIRSVHKRIKGRHSKGQPEIAKRGCLSAQIAIAWFIRLWLKEKKFIASKFLRLEV